MKVLIIGGAGFIGGALSTVLIAKGCQCEILDKGLFGIDEQYEQYEVGEDCLNPDNIKKYDCVVWACDCDTKNFFDSNGEVYDCAVRYAEENLKLFANVAELSKRMISLIPDIDFVEDGNYRTFIVKKQNLAFNKKVELVYVNEVFGTSPRMRFDTLINGMVYNAIIYDVMYVEKPMSVLPAIALNRLLEAIVVKIESGSIEDLKLASFIFNQAGYASLIKTKFSKTMVNFKTVQILFSEEDSNISNCNRIHGNALKNYTMTGSSEVDFMNYVRNILASVNAGLMVMKDTYNNEKIYTNFINYKNIHKLMLGD